MASRRSAYLDSSALVKLVVDEDESPALEEHVRGAALVSSEIAIVELTRACGRAAPGPATEARARELLDGATLVALARPLLDRAARLAPPLLGSLDAIHLATALEVEPDELVAYDRRLREAAATLGLAVASPA